MAARAPYPANAVALAHVPGLAPGETPVAVESLAGGLANRSLLVTTRAGRFVVRTRERPHILGIDAHRREAHLQRLAAGAGLAPGIVWASDHGDVLVTEYVAGRVWSAHDMQDPSGLRRLCAAWRALRALPLPEFEPFDGVATAKRYRDTIVATDADDARHLDAAADEAVRLARAIRAEGRAPTIVHGDPHHSNVVDDGARVKLIDWEYAALADPLVDPGCLLAYYPAARTFAARLLEWSGLSAVADVAALDRVRRLYELLSLLWARALGPRPSGADDGESAD
jgi:aminoglycoside phosphotransferase (APT) family kinase protein